MCYKGRESIRQGIYKGSSALLKEELPTHVHTWYYAHELNLVTGDVTGSVRQSTKLFNLLNNITVFSNNNEKENEKME